MEILRKTRANFLNVIEDLTIEQLNKIPQGFNNNIIWNLGHLLVTQQSLCYLKAGLKTTIDDHYFLNYKPETRPNGFVESAEVEKIKELFISAVGQLDSDYNKNAFTNYIPWTNRYGIEITNIDDAISYVLFHEGIHLGYVMDLKRLIKI